MEEIDILSRFEVKREDGKVIKFKIHIVGKEHYNEINAFASKIQMREEVFCKSTNVGDREESRREYEMVYQKLLENEDTYVLLCSIDDPNSDDLQIVGCNVVYEVRQEEDLTNLVETHEVKSFLNILNVLYGHYSLRNSLQVAVTLEGAGLVVDPLYRGCGVATEILKARVLFAKKLGIDTGACFTSLGSQKAAERAGYKVGFEIPYKDFGDKCGINFINAPTTLKYMFVRPSQ